LLDKNKIEIIKHYEKNFRSSGHLLFINVIGFNERMRNQFIADMAELGIATNVHYKPLPMFTAYKNLGFKIEDFPNAKNKYINEITLPLHTLLNEEDIGYIAESIKSLI